MGEDSKCMWLRLSPEFNYVSHYHISLLWAESTLHVSLLACPLAAQWAQMTPGNCSEGCTWKGVMRWDVLQWAGKWRSVRHSWVMGWHALKHYASPSVSLLSTTVYYLFCCMEEKRKKNLLSLDQHRCIRIIYVAGFCSKALIFMSCSCFAWK